MISQRLFEIFDLDKNSILNLTEFTNGLLRLFSYNFTAMSELIFQVIDFDGNGLISKEDIRIILSHIPMAVILESIRIKLKKEGDYTKNGGGLY